MAPTTRKDVVKKEDVKKTDDAFDMDIAYSPENVQHNMRIASRCRTFLSIVAGFLAGILGLTGLSGFLCYFIIMFFASAGLAAKTKFSVASYFDSWHRVAFDGVLQGLMSFVLFWTFAYDIVHIF